MENKNIIIGVVVIVLVVALGYMAFDTETTEEIPEDRELVVGTTDTATTLDPANAYDYFSSAIL